MIEDRVVAEVAPGLWRLEVEGEGSHRVLMLVTDEGMAVVDPVSEEVGRWIGRWAQDRFAIEVRLVIYSHAHYDHIGGGGVLQATGASVVAHRNAVEPIVGERLPTGIPDRTFDRDLVLELGGEEIRLNWVAPSHSNSMVIVQFPRQRLLLATDFCPVGRVPFNDFPDFYYDGWMESLDWVGAQDFDFLDSGHGYLGGPADVDVQVSYMRTLHDEVLRLVRAGQSWDELYRNVRFSDESRVLGGFAQMSFANIVGMYRWVASHRRGIY